MHIVKFSQEYLAWCVFKKESNAVTMKFIEGPFYTEKLAEENARLHDSFDKCTELMMPNVKLTG